MTVGTDGTFVRRGLGPGQYFVVGRANIAGHVWAKWPNYGSIWFYPNGDCETAELIRLVPGQQFNFTWDIR
jgi:hypothetical protein